MGQPQKQKITRKIIFIGKDLACYQNIKDRFQEMYPLELFVFGEMFENDKNQLLRLIPRILSESPQVVFIDYSIHRKELPELARFLRNDIAGKKILTIGLLENIEAKTMLLKSVGRGVFLNFVKGSETINIIHHTMAIIGPEMASDVEFSLAKTSEELVSKTLFRLIFLTPKYIHFESNFNYLKGTTIRIISDLKLNPDLSFNYIVAGEYDYDLKHYYQKAYDFKFDHMDSTEIDLVAKKIDEIESKLANLKALSDVLAKINSCETILAGQQSNLAKEQKNSVDDINAVVKNWNALVPEERKALGCFNLVAATDYAEAIKVYHVLEPTVPVIEKRQAALKGIELIDSVKIHLKVVDEKTNNAGIIQSRLSTLRELLKIVEETRKGYIDSVLKNIASDIEKLYISLHPAEGLGGIQFMIDPNKIGSLDLNGCFQGANAVLPQAYYSESHLDTLGICIFLALAKYFKTEVVVLDDVVTSADEVHMTRYIDMLHNEANSFDQVILTTHYRTLLTDSKGNP